MFFLYPDCWNKRGVWYQDESRCCWQVQKHIVGKTFSSLSMNKPDRIVFDNDGYAPKISLKFPFVAPLPSSSCVLFMLISIGNIDHYHILLTQSANLFTLHFVVVICNKVALRQNDDHSETLLCPDVLHMKNSHCSFFGLRCSNYAILD